MKNALKYCLIAIISIGFFINGDVSANKPEQTTCANSGIYLEGLYDLFIEPTIESPYIFILPKGNYQLVRTEKLNSSIVETYFGDIKENTRYKMLTGFLLLRTDTNRSNKYRTQEESEKEIDVFLDLQILEHKVFFYDQNYIFSSKDLVVNEGKIFSPFMDAKGLYFLKRENPVYKMNNYTSGGYYLLYYSFDLEYELAKKRI
ncbi:MAG: hypothetical protein H0T62_03635 [Parachlamydiaceae bacterium]|nr:hypothetical protein [Parachlamydiaceae bacterium]